MHSSQALVQTQGENLLRSCRLLTESLRRKLLAENRSPRTIQTYGEALRLFGDYLDAQGMPQDAARVRREHVEAFIADLLERSKPATASNRYRALRVFFEWCVEEGEVKPSPMAKMKPPHVPEEPPALLSEQDVRRLLKACEGSDFESRRDTAILRMFVDTGHEALGDRRAEAC